MRRRIALITGLVALLAGGALLAGCGDHEVATEVVEGEPLELGELSYNVAITRFLNSDDVEDSEYLAGQPPEPAGKSYLGVFLAIRNHSEDEAYPSADSYTVIDTTDAEFEPIESDNPYALQPGDTVPADGQLPLPDSSAFYGPTQGSLLLFLVDDGVSENRPLRLEIGSSLGDGEVLLDI